MDDGMGDRHRQLMLVSRLLIDAVDLDQQMGAVFLKMLDALDATWPLADMAAAFAPLESRPPDERERKIVALLNANPSWMTAASNVLNVWYSGQLQRPAPDQSYVPAPPSAYLGALVWRLVNTHPSGVPGPYFGEWAYPPGAL